MAFEFTEEHWQKIEKMAGSVKAIEQELKGYDGNPGLCKKVDNNTKAINKLWIVIAFVIGATGISIGILQVLG